jgi:hypothetical protein
MFLFQSFKNPLYLASYLPSSNTFRELIDTQFEWFSFHDFIVVVFVKFLTRIHTFGFFIFRCIFKV